MPSNLLPLWAGVFLVWKPFSEEILVSQTDQVEVLDPATQYLCDLGQLTCLL